MVLSNTKYDIDLNRYQSKSQCKLCLPVGVYFPRTHVLRVDVFFKILMMLLSYQFWMCVWVGVGILFFMSGFTLSFSILHNLAIQTFSSRLSLLL